MVNGNTAEIIQLKEIIIASLGLLLVPKNIEINITDIIGKTKLLPNVKNRILEKTENTVYKLNNVSETIAELADTYKEVAATTVETEVDVYQQSRNMFVDGVLTNIEPIPDNVLYEDMIQLENGILDELFEQLMQKDEIDFQDMVDVFEKRNIYLLSTSDKEIKRDIEKDIWRMVKIVNSAYGISKVNFMWTQKSKENQKNLSNQLDGISKVITSVAEELVEKPEENVSEKQNKEIQEILKQRGIIYKDITLEKQKNGSYKIEVFVDKFADITEELNRIHKIEEITSKILRQEIVLQKQKEMETAVIQIYTSKDNYQLQLGIAKTTKNKSSISGDSNLQIRLEDGKYLLALSDGMGSGPNAKRNSQIAIKMLKRLLMSGFDKEVSLQLINSTIFLNTTQEMYATLDISILDLYTGNMEIVKNGAVPTYIKNQDKIQKIDSQSLPAGIVENMELVVHDIDLKVGDIIVMCTDGIIDAKKDDPQWIEELLQQIQTDNVQKIADLILTEAMDYNYGLPKDDMTVIVGKICPNGDAS